MRMLHALAAIVAPLATTTGRPIVRLFTVHPIALATVLP